MSPNPAARTAEAESAPKKSMTFGGYIGAYASLLILSGLTFGLSFAHLGSLEWLAALGIATIKALIVAWFFMHLIEMSAAYRLSGVIAVTLLATLVLFAMADVWTRSSSAEPEPPQAATHHP